MSQKQFTISGAILSQHTKTGIANLSVKAWDKDLFVPDFVGEATTDANGKFIIKFTQKYFSELFFDRKPDLFFKIYDGEKLIHNTKENVLWNIDGDKKDIEIFIDMESKSKNASFSVRGKIIDKNKRTLSNLLVRAYDRDMRTESFLGECISDSKGEYVITYSKDQFEKDEKQNADLSVKVYTASGKNLLFSTTVDKVVFNASERETINISIEKEIIPEENEFDLIRKEISVLIGKVPMHELQEDKDHKDITFLSRETDIVREKLEHFAIAHRLHHESEIDADFFYALLRKNTLLRNDAGKLNVRFSIGINSEIQYLIYDAALADTKIIKDDVENAVTEMIVAPEVALECGRNIELLQHFKKRAEEYYNNEHPKKTIDIAIRFVTEGKLQEAGKLFQENKNDLTTFFEKLTDDSFFSRKNKTTSAETNNIPEQLFGLDNEILSHVIQSHNILKREDVKRLAKLNKAEWIEEFKKAKSKRTNADNASTAGLFASVMVRKMEQAYPTMAYTAQLEREKNPVLKNQENIIAFLNKHEDFDFTKHNVDLFFRDKKISQNESDAIREELKSVQRVFKLIPHYGKTNALRKKNIHSSQSIVAAGETRFVNEIAFGAGIEKKEAKEIFIKATHITTATMLIVGELQGTISGMDIASIETSGLEDKLKTTGNDFPNLKSLFKLTDNCACEHCRSVYSPAAYMVEILQFLDKRSVFDISSGVPVPTNLAKDLLFERRPDLGEIDLSCENANTPVKYIDLVCELLEDAISPNKIFVYDGILSDGKENFKGTISNGLFNFLQAHKFPVTDQAQVFETEVPAGALSSKFSYLRDKKLVCKIERISPSHYHVSRLKQTLSAADELAAAPEYVNVNAYNDFLSQKHFAFKLPFDLNHVEAQAYFDRFGISRAELMKTFRVGVSPTNESIAGEKLGLTNTEIHLIVNPQTTSDDQQKIWNAPDGDVLNYMKRVDHFLDKTGLTYNELNLLLTLNFIDPLHNLFIKHEYDDPKKPSISCDTEKKEIENLSLAALDRIHRFLRLQKKTGWKFEVLDEIIAQEKLGNKILDSDCLIKAASLIDISEKTGIKIEELIGFYGEFPHQVLNNESKPLYQQVFLNKAKNGFIDENLLPEKINGLKAISDLQPGLAVYLQLKEQDLENLLSLLPVNDKKLNFSNLSYLFAASVLIKKLKLQTEDFIIITELAGLNISASPQKTLDFIHAVENFRLSPLKSAEVKYMLRHKADMLPVIDDKIKQVLEKLQKDYQANFFLNKSKFDHKLPAEEQKETFQAELSKLSGIEEADVKKFIQFIDKEWKDWDEAKHFAFNKLNDLFDTTLIENKIEELKGGAVTDKDLLKLVQVFLNSIAAFQLESGKRTILEQTLSTGFKVDPELVKIVLEYAKLKQPDQGNVKLSEILYSDSLIDTNTIHIEPEWPDITKATFDEQHAAIKLLNKLFPLINSFKLSLEEVEWYFKNNRSLGWFEWDNIPYDDSVGKTAADYHEYSNFIALLDLAKQFPPVVNPADAEHPVSFLSVALMILQTVPPERNQFITALSLLLGYEKTDVDAIDEYLHPKFNIDRYKSASTWQGVIDCAESQRKLGIEIKQIVKCIEPTLLDTHVNILRTALKSRYDEATWLGTLKEIMDAIRPQKRDALVAYLLATRPEFKNENDLFDYFLVDVEMESCMPSSRIVQAHSTIQLFVQRCLMGLEPKAAADLDHDKSWEQWKWMKNYRVWEANRKVFLYPENWIEPDLRDEKSFLFTELENELKQNELTNFTAEQALINYLEKLDNIAFLEVLATWYDVDTKIMHVFARTKGGDPGVYYYRRFEQESTWTPWEKVELDISGNQLLAFMRNNRLCLAWPMFSDEYPPEQKAKLPDQSNSGEQKIDQPKKKLKIQLAISEFANGKWQTKKVSQDAITTPSDYVSEEIPKDKFKLIYNELFDQIIFSREYVNQLQISHDELRGAFDIAGCKGYPELANIAPIWLNFIPEFVYTQLVAQRHSSVGAGTTLTECNAHTLLTNKESETFLYSTPDIFRITNANQLTEIDLFITILEYLAFLIKEKDMANMKFPLGTMLPYFMEDSKQAYVIIPGFYQKHNEYSMPGVPYLLTDAEKKTGADIFQLIDNIIKLVFKYAIEDQGKPYDKDAKTKELIDDADFKNIMKELALYEGLDYLYTLLDAGLEGKFPKKEGVKELVYGEQFKNMYHPLVCALRTTLYKKGIPELMKRETQLQRTGFDFLTHYWPDPTLVPLTTVKDEKGGAIPVFPIEDIDFNNDGSYSSYNWELFFHVPFLLATRLTKNQRFEEALTWFHYIFNPTGALSGSTPQKYWITKPFYLNQEADYISERIDSLLYNVANGTNDLKEAILQWRDKPFKPDVVARFRPVAYQKAVLMKYIDNLTEWGDNLFRQDTMESIAQATQMYILADKLLGPKPRTVPPAVKAPYETYNQIESKLDNFGNALIDLENIIPDLSALPESGKELPPSPSTLSMLYFCIPQNDKMLEYWNRIADRLFKIRHCQNIDGIERNLALFAPPIDPAMLVRAAASGLDISAVLAGINAPTPYYRFNVLSQKATELAQEVRGLGNSLLQALEKKDAEAMSLLRSEMEMKVLNAVTDMKTRQIDEAMAQIDILNATKLVTEERYKYYNEIEYMNENEQLNLELLEKSFQYQEKAQLLQALAGLSAIIPDISGGVAGVGGSPEVNVKFGGENLLGAAKSAADVMSIYSSSMSYAASRAATTGGHLRRWDDWKLQERLAFKELNSIAEQITAAEIRRDIAQADLKNHRLQIENAKKTDEFMRSKFTNQELYNWMIGQISSVYFSAYQLAHDFAKKAERSYRFELGNDDSFISFGYWDSMKKGLQSADQLIHDIKRMETSYLDKNKREYELTKHVSLSMLDPFALVKLRSTGTCDFDIPEVLYDMDYAGQYFRRIKSVSISMPCIAGPYTSVSAKLSLVNNRYRKNANLLSDLYQEDMEGDDRFIYNVGAIQSIAASNAQNDSGVFELNFRDERYLPFEGTGAISGWRLELPEIKQFDYNTISDVVIHVKYTAREGGSTLKGKANDSLKIQVNALKQKFNGEEGLHVALNLKHDFSNEWHLLKQKGKIDLKIDKSRLPYMAQALNPKIAGVVFMAKMKNDQSPFFVKINDGKQMDFAKMSEWELSYAKIDSGIDLDTTFKLSADSIQLNDLEELMMLVKYNF